MHPTIFLLYLIMLYVQLPEGAHISKNERLIQDITCCNTTTSRGIISIDISDQGEKRIIFLTNLLRERFGIVQRSTKSEA